MWFSLQLGEVSFSYLNLPPCLLLLCALELTLLSGVAAVLRFPLPEPDESEDSDSDE